ncbi:hypothetical protein MVES1_000086 [Malassezia vespertilionis]|nr:uncharacterized protein MVES1_000086 [Malassezia vespertilionis]WFD04762.1 hypothetical protein MVES1_000086 [Malassezia vespertilionis]
MGFAEYVAACRAKFSGEEDDVLHAACDFVFAMQSYAMAAHGIRALPLRRAAQDVQDAIRRGAVKSARAQEAITQGMQSLHDMVEHTEGVCMTLAKAYSDTQKTATMQRSTAETLKDERKQLDMQVAKFEKEKRAYKSKYRECVALQNATEERAAALEETRVRLEREHAHHLARAHEGLASAKSASVDAIRRATLREQEAEASISSARDSVRAAEERAAEALQALQETRAKDQRLADQMRSMQSALERAKDKQRAMRAQLDKQAHKQKQDSSPARSSQAAPCSPRSVTREACAVPRSPLAPKRRNEVLDDLDDTHFPMPGGNCTRPWSVPKPKQATLDTWAPKKHPVVLGPRRRARPIT